MNNPGYWLETDLSLIRALVAKPPRLAVTCGRWTTPRVTPPDAALGKTRMCASFTRTVYFVAHLQ